MLGGGGLITGAVSYQNTSGGTTTLKSSDIANMDPNCTANGTCPNGPGTDAAAIKYYNQFPLANSKYFGRFIEHRPPTPSFSRANSSVHEHRSLSITILTSEQSIFVRGNLQSDNLSSTLQFPGRLRANSSIYGNNKGIAAGHVWNVNSALMNNFRYGYIRQGTATMWCWEPAQHQRLRHYSLTSTTTSSIYIVPTHNFADDVTFTKGRHTIQFGFNNRLINDNRYADNTLYPTGNISAVLLATAAIAGKGTSLDPGCVYPAVWLFACGIEL